MSTAVTVTWEVWRAHPRGPDVQVPGGGSKKQAKALLAECREMPIVGIAFYLVKATTLREKVKG